MMDDLFDRIMDAHRHIRPQVPVTPLEHSIRLSAEIGCEVLLKCDHHQPTGSFKIRGATNKMRLLSPQARRAGVTTASTGNHGKASAFAGARAGVPVTVYMSSAADPTKMAAIKALGADLVTVDGNAVKAETLARRHAGEQGQVYISPYNDPDIMAGQGTLGVELAEQAPDLDAVFIATGGGGLIGGTGTALKALSPKTRVVGVWPANSPVLLRSLQAGKLIDVEEFDTLSDSTAGAVEPGSITFPIAQKVIDETVEVGEAEIASAMRKIAETERWMVEGAAGVALAGLIKCADAYRGKRVAVIICGRNIALETFLKAVAKT
jgi:threonine dehydratase